MTERRSNCPLACALDIIGDKWTLLVLRDMLVAKKSKFDEFLQSPEKIATNILTDRLQKLESAGLITKEQYGTHRKRMAYFLTDKGKTLIPVLKHIADWGTATFPNTSRMTPKERSKE